MAVQTRNDIIERSLILEGNPKSIDSVTFAQVSPEGAGIATNTVISMKADGEYVALTDNTAVDGTEVPRAVYIGEPISSADLLAGTVTGKSLLTGDSLTVDQAELVLQNGLDLDDIVTSQKSSIRQLLVEKANIYTEAVEYESQHENDPA